jgi:predicted PurR-regulated permease PerM
VNQPRGPLLSSPAVARAARWGVVAWSLIGVAILAYWGYRYVISPVGIIFPPLVLALIILYLLNPVVSRLERRGIPRIWGALLTYIVFLSAVGLALSYLIPLVSRQVATFVENVPGLVERIQEGIQDLARRLGFTVGIGDDLVSELQANLQGQSGTIIATLISFTAGVFHLALILILGPILAFYLLVDLPKIMRTVHAAIPARRRAEVESVGGRMSAAVGGFFRGQLLVAVFVGLASMLVLYLVGLPYWALVGLLTGLFNLIPLIGPFIGGAVAVLIAFTTQEPDAGFLIHPEPGWPLAVASSVGLLLVQQIDNHIISPNIVGRTVKLHPVTVMLSLLAAGTLLGLWGILLAIPVVASVKILVMHYWDTRSSWPPRPPGSSTTEGALPPATAQTLSTEEPAVSQAPAQPVAVPRAEPQDVSETASHVREGVTGHWWWRWRVRLPWRRHSDDGRRKAGPTGETDRAPETATPKRP